MDNKASHMCATWIAQRLRARWALVKLANFCCAVLLISCQLEKPRTCVFLLALSPEYLHSRTKPLKTSVASFRVKPLTLNPKPWTLSNLNLLACTCHRLHWVQDSTSGGAGVFVLMRLLQMLLILQYDYYYHITITISMTIIKFLSPVYDFG